MVNKILIAVSTFVLGFILGIGNQTLTYGDTGYPKNCRAIIAANMNGYYTGIYTASEALSSIDRNCGAHGYSWGNR